MNCHECVGYLNEYALGILNPADANRVSQHLVSGCESCKKTLASIDVATASLATTLAPIAPPTEIKSHLLRAIRKNPLPHVELLNAESASSSGDAGIGFLKDELPHVTPRSMNRSKYRLLSLGMATAAAVLGAIFAYRTTLLLQDYRSNSTAMLEIDAEQFRANVLARHQKSSNALRLVSVPSSHIPKGSDSNEPTGYVVFDVLAKQLHVAIDLKGQAKASIALYCESVNTEGKHYLLGEIEPRHDSLTLGAFDLPSDNSKIVKILVFDDGDSSSAKTSRRKILEMDLNLDANDTRP
jgi:anti-sigma factor RsiW